MARTCMKFGAWLMIFIGLGIIALGSYTNWQITHDSLPHLYNDDNRYLKRLQQYGIQCIGGIVFLFGVCGAVGAAQKRRRVFLLIIYDIGALAIAIGFLTIAGITYFKARQIFSGSPTSEPWLKEIDDTVNLAELNFCQAGCPCYIKDYSSSYPVGLITSADTTQTDFSKCPQFNKQNAQAAQLLSAAEDIFECAGWSKASPIYLFSNVNDGIPTNQTCFAALDEFFDKRGNIFGLIFLGLGIFFLIQVILSISYCVYGYKKKTGNFYQKMGYYDQDMLL